MSGRLGKYELLSKIATGGMAEIHLARTRTAGVDRVVVIKKLLPQYVDRSDFVDMFLDEARIIAALSHPNIVQMFDFGTVAEGSFIAMEYLHGEDLRTVAKKFLTTKTLIPIEHAVHVIAAAAAGLHHVHEARRFDGEPLQIVHRDVSPHNIIVTFDGATKLLDFGIAKGKHRTSETRHGALKGKVPYMAPEQLTSSSLDRRTDTYALGVVLYELLTGKRPYLVPKRGEFDLMMAIARGQTRPILQAKADLPAPLAEIVMKAIARAPGDRFQTAAEMQAALEEFARESKLVLTPSALAGFMRSTFGERVERWGRERAAGRAFAEYAVDVELERASTHSKEDDYVLEESTMLESESLGAETEPHSRALDVGAELAAISQPGVDLHHHQVGDVHVVKIAGRLSEALDGTAIGKALRGSVVLDLHGVERITSYGVREWLSLMSEARTNQAVVYFARLSEVVVSQMSMIRSFSSGGAIVSFEAPYLCDACGTAFRHLVDCERNADVILSQDQRGSASKAPCPSCGTPASLDDDPSYFAFAAAHAGVGVPNAVRSAIDSLADDRSSPESVEKLVSAESTKIRLRGEIDRTFRWNRALDGLEGKVAIDFEGARIQPDGVHPLVRALGVVDREVTAVELFSCPVAVLTALGAASSGRIRIVSLAASGRCASCNALRTTTISLDAFRREKRITCRRCSGPLASPEIEVALTALSLGPAVPAPSSAATEDPVFVDPTGAGVQRRAIRASSNRSLVILGVAVSVSALVLILSLVATRSPPDPAPARTATSAAADALPAWSKDSVRRDTESVVIVGKSGPVLSEDQGFALAQADAIRLLSSLILEEMSSSVVKTYLLQTVQMPPAPASSPERARAVASRFLRLHGATGTPERLETAARRSPGGVEVYGLFRITSASLRAMAQVQGRSVTTAGVTMAPVFPLLDGPTEGDVIVIAADDRARKAGLTAGAVVLKIDDRPITSLESIAPANPRTTAKRSTFMIDNRGETHRIVLAN